MLSLALDRFWGFKLDPLICMASGLLTELSPWLSTRISEVAEFLLRAVCLAQNNLVGVQEGRGLGKIGVSGGRGQLL